MIKNEQKNKNTFSNENTTQTKNKTTKKEKKHKKGQETKTKIRTNKKHHGAVRSRIQKGCPGLSCRLTLRADKPRLP